MKIQSFALSAIAVAALSLSFNASAGERRYHYEGDDSARSICLAIAKDQVNRLQRSLRAQRVGLSDTHVHERFRCNGMSLADFAQQMNAQKTQGYLARRFDLAPEAVAQTPKKKSDKKAEKDRS